MKKGVGNEGEKTYYATKGEWHSGPIIVKEEEDLEALGLLLLLLNLSLILVEKRREEIKKEIKK